MFGAMADVTHDDADFCASTLYGCVWCWLGELHLFALQSKRNYFCDDLDAIAFCNFDCLYLVAEGVYWLRVIAGLFVVFLIGVFIEFRFASDYLAGGKESILMGFTNMLSVLVGPVAMIIAGMLQRLILQYLNNVW